MRQGKLRWEIPGRIIHRRTLWQLALSFAIILLLSTLIYADCWTSDFPNKDRLHNGPENGYPGGGYDPDCPTAAQIYSEVPGSNGYCCGSGARVDGPCLSTCAPPFQTYQVPSCYTSNCCGGRPSCCDHGLVYCEEEFNITVSTTTIPRCEELPLPNHCCPKGFEYDITFSSCMPEGEAVKLVKMHSTSMLNKEKEGMPGRFCVQVGYCEEKIEETQAKIGGEGTKCAQDEGPCRIKNRKGDDIQECKDGLLCSKSPGSTSLWDTACCKPDQQWNGKSCVKMGTETPWLATWTRSGGNPKYTEVSDLGGGSITVYGGAGAMIPNGTEAAGWGAKCSKSPCDDDRWTAGGNRPYCGSKFVEWTVGWKNDKECNEAFCKVCEAAWPYRIPPSPIWFEARNLGNDYRWADRVQTCNGPFAGIDATVKPFKGKTDAEDITIPADLECMSADCNCGRDMFGLGDPYDGTKPADGTSSCGPGGCGIRLGGEQSCNVQQKTSCIRGDTNDATMHNCNTIPKGHGGFVGTTPGNDPNFDFKPAVGEKTLASDSPVDPRKEYHGLTGWKIVPEVCGRIQRKEVDTVNGYYPPSAKTTKDLAPLSWFDWMITEYDKDGSPVPGTPIVFTFHSKERITALPPLAGPHIVLRDDQVTATLKPKTRYLSVNMKYTIHNEIKRKLMAKQCTWLGCSRIEETLEKYDQSVCMQRCDGTWDCDHKFDISTGNAPCCCTPQNDAGPRKCVTDPNNPLDYKDCWTCKQTFPRCCPIGLDPNGLGQSDCNNPDGCGIGSCVTKLYWRKQQNCQCTYTCWGCWHLNGDTDNYPVSMPDSNGEEQIVYEVINDTSSVDAKPYGEHLRVENPLGVYPQGGTAVMNTATGKIFYGYEDASTYASGYLTLKSVDNETGLIDLFGGFRLSVPKQQNGYVTILTTGDLFTKSYIFSNDMTALQSTFLNDYVVIKNDSAKLLGLLDICYKKSTGMIGGTGLSNKKAANPFFFRWTINPAKKYYNYYDLSAAHGTKYNWENPLMLVDKVDPSCVNYFDERSWVIGLYKNFHEDEPLYYDYQQMQIQQEDIEQNFAQLRSDPNMLGNVQPIAYSKPIEGFHVRYAPACDGAQYANKKLACTSSTVNCPDMCSAVATPFCNSAGQCDCAYTGEFQYMLPMSQENCQDVSTPKLSDPLRCEGAPNRYKSFCSDGVFHAYWMDTSQYRFKWNPAGACEITYIKECTPKVIPPNSYTLIFDRSSSLTKEDFNNMELTMYNNFRRITFKPFSSGPTISAASMAGAESTALPVEPRIAAAGPCEPPSRSVDIGGDLKVDVKKPHPEEYNMEKVGEYVNGAGQRIYRLKVTAKDQCTAAMLAPASVTCDKIYIRFNYPYAGSTNYYTAGSIIDVPVIRGSDIVADLDCRGDSGLRASPSFTSITPVPVATSTCDYLMENIWVLLIAYALVMSYRFFSGRVMDFRDMWEEFQGKK